MFIHVSKRIFLIEKFNFCISLTLSRFRNFHFELDTQRHYESLINCVSKKRLLRNKLNSKQLLWDTLSVVFGVYIFPSSVFRIKEKRIKLKFRIHSRNDLQFPVMKLNRCLFYEERLFKKCRNTFVSTSHEILNNVLVCVFLNILAETKLCYYFESK